MFKLVLKAFGVVVTILVAIPALLVAADPFLRSHVAAGERERWAAPDGSATIIVYGAFSIVEMFTPRFPGQGSDSPGIVRVFDGRGKMIEQYALGYLGAATPIMAMGSHCAQLDRMVCWPARVEDRTSPD